MPDNRTREDGPNAIQPLGAVLAAPWFSIWNPEEAGRRMALARGPAVLLSLVATSLVAVVIAVPVELWDRLLEWHWTSASTGFLRETHTLGEAWEDWVDDSLPRLPWMVIGTILYSASICVLGALLVWPRVLCSGKLRRSLDLAGRGVAATVGAFVVWATAMKVAGILATDRMYALQEKSALVWDGRTRPDDPLAAVWNGLSWLCAPIWFACVVRAVRGARSVITPPGNSLTCEGCGYALTHQSELGRCTECGVELSLSVHPELARPDTPWDRQPSVVSWLETTRLALFHPSKLYRRLRLRGDDRRSGAFAMFHYVLLASAVFLLHRFVPWRRILEIWSWEFPSVAALNTAAFVTAFAWLLHRVFGMIVTVTAMKRGWVPAGAQAGKIVDYQVVFLWPLTFVGMAWMLAIGAWPPGFWFFGVSPSNRALDAIPSLVPSPALALLLQQVLIWGPPALLMVFWLRRYGLARRAVRWANF